MKKSFRAYTVLEVLIAVTVLALFLIGAFSLQNDMLVSYKYGSFKAEQQRAATNALNLLRADLDKACYPSKVFADGTVIFGGNEPQSSATPDSDPGDSNKVLYKNGRTSTPGPILRFVINNPIYDQAILDRLTPQSKSLSGRVTRCSLELQDAGNGRGLNLVYFRNTTPTPDKVDTGPGGRILLRYVDYVEISAVEILPSAFDSDMRGNYRRTGGALPAWQKGGELSIKISQNSKYLGGWSFGRKRLGVTVDTSAKAVAKVQVLPNL